MKTDKTHVILPGSHRPKDPQTVHVRDVDPKEKIDLTIKLHGPKLPGPDEHIGETITEGKLEEDYGAKRADADKVAKTLKKFGIKLESVSLATKTMRVIGTGAAIEAAFKPDMSIVRSARQAGEYRARSGSLRIPKELKGIVKGVYGIDERRMARRKSASPSADDGKRLTPLSPDDLEQRYNFPPGDAGGQNIAIAEFGGGYFADDTKAYCVKFQRPTPNVQAISVDAPAYTLQEVFALPVKQRKAVLDDATEVMMDVQVVAGLCPGANISVYFSTFDEQGWIDLLNAVIKAKPVVLSCSWGLAEEDPGWSAGAISSIQDGLNAARLLGITICVSSGDDGSSDGIEDGKAHVDFPGSSPFVLSVGGTMLKKSGGAVSEVTWWETPGRRIENNGGGATGGGVSLKFDRPTWQNVRIESLNANSRDGRVVPDVSALAGHPLYALILIGQSAPNGGTSASAPLWAALIARINAKLSPAKRQRYLTPLLYKNLANGKSVGKVSSRDITSGNNATFPKPGRGYTAGSGFDAVTGWGVPDGVALLNSLEAI
jgi:kumamolisin